MSSGIHIFYQFGFRYSKIKIKLNLLAQQYEDKLLAITMHHIYHLSYTDIVVVAKRYDLYSKTYN